MSEDKKWVAVWGNAMSINENKPESCSKNITLRYPIYCPFSGDRLRVTFDNYCGIEDVTITRASILYKDKFYKLSFDQKESVKIAAKESVVSDEVEIEVSAEDTFEVLFYLGDYTSMRSSVVALGPLSSGRYAIGDMSNARDWSIDISRKTNVFYFLSNVSIYTSANNHALICYGDSITAQDWPDYLKLKLKEKGINNVSVIRRATSGSRILREYSCITYESYGLKGTNRFDHECRVDGADTILIQQGINDIIHPVGEAVNPFRPMSDLPTCEELIDGLKWYLDKSLEFGLKPYVGTLLPIKGWRTYEDFREVFKNDYNDWIRENTTCVDFDEAVRDSADPRAFKEEYDSGDHLHPSAKGYEAMAEAALSRLFILR